MTSPRLMVSKWDNRPLILVGGIPTPLKNMNSSVGMMKFPIYGKMFQTTNQFMINTDNDISDMSSDI